MTLQQRARIAAYAHFLSAEGIGPYGHRLTCPGEPRRRQTRLLPLWMAYAQYRHLEHDKPPFIAPARPSGPRRIVRAA